MKELPNYEITEYQNGLWRDIRQPALAGGTGCHRAVRTWLVDGGAVLLRPLVPKGAKHPPEHRHFAVYGGGGPAVVAVRKPATQAATGAPAVGSDGRSRSPLAAVPAAVRGNDQWLPDYHGRWLVHQRVRLV